MKAKKKLARRMKLAMRRKEAANRAPTSQVIVEGDMIIPVTGHNAKKAKCDTAHWPPRRLRTHRHASTSK